MEGLFELTNPLSNGTIPTPYGLLFPKIGASQPHPKLQSLLSQERVRLYRLQIWLVQSQGQCEQKPTKILEKRERGRFQGLPNFLSTPIISGTSKATNFKFCKHIHVIDRNKNPLNISGEVAVGVLGDSRKFSGHPYIVRIARSSLR